MISENEVAGTYSVSRTPVKSAFIRLENEGFIEVIPQKGTMVTLIDYKHICDTIYMRYVLELDMINTIIRDFTEKELEKLLKALDTNLKEQKRLASRKKTEPTMFYELDNQFHHLMFSHTNKEHIWTIIQDTEVYYTRFRLLDTKATARYDELYKEHVELVQAIKERNATAAQRALHDHLHKILSLFVRATLDEYKDYLINYDIK